MNLDPDLPLAPKVCAKCRGAADGPEPWWHAHCDNGKVTWKHMDCCAADGCPSRGEDSCDHALAQAGGQRGDQLRAFLHARAGIG